MQKFIITVTRLLNEIFYNLEGTTILSGFNSFVKLYLNNVVFCKIRKIVFSKIILVKIHLTIGMWLNFAILNLYGIIFLKVLRIFLKAPYRSMKTKILDKYYSLKSNYSSKSFFNMFLCRFSFLTKSLFISFNISFLTIQFLIHTIAYFQMYNNF